MAEIELYRIYYEISTGKCATPVKYDGDLLYFHELSVPPMTKGKFRSLYRLSTPEDLKL